VVSDSVPVHGGGVPDPQRLRRLLGAPELRRLLERIRTRLERGHGAGGSVTLTGATEAERLAVAGLLGRPPGRGATLTVEVGQVERVLQRAGLAPDLRTAVELLTGPLADRQAERAAAEAAWAAALAPAVDLAGRRPVVAAWVEQLATSGLLRRLASGDPAVAAELVRWAVAVIDRLPAGWVPKPVLAATAAGHGHRLDNGRPLATLVIGAAARLGGIEPGAGAEWRRTVWASVEVLDGELTNPVLVLNLPGDQLTPTGRVLAEWRRVGQPVHLSARHLVHDPPELELQGRTVFVCENPTVVAEAANRLGPGSLPLVCTSTHPGAAATLLLRALTAAGAVLRYHGDFDWPGITFANSVIGRFGALPWRLDERAYRAAAVTTADTAALRGVPVPACWDPGLTHAMASVGIRVEEEHVIDDLMADLAAPLGKDQGLL
jgi:uncharacterized protein (TIGR02679 family)